LPHCQRKGSKNDKQSAKNIYIAVIGGARNIKRRGAWYLKMSKGDEGIDDCAQKSHSSTETGDPRRHNMWARPLVLDRLKQKNKRSEEGLYHAESDNETT